MVNQLPLSDGDLAPARKSADGTQVLTSDLAYRAISIVNVIFYGDPTGKVVGSDRYGPVDFERSDQGVRGPAVW